MLYEMNDKSLTGISRTSFQEERVAEADLQEALREHPEFIESGLFVISDEFTDWEDAWRYIDLLCIDSSGRLVVVELKRGDGVHMELQAIRYAAMMANFPTQGIIEGHARYLRNKGISGTPEEHIRKHLGLASDEDISIATEQPRIVLVSEDFNKEITTSVLWLNDVGLDIRCVRVRAYRHQGKLLLDIDQVIPLPEAQDYLVTARNREQETQIQQQNATGDQPLPSIDRFIEAIGELVPTQQEDFKSVLSLVNKLLEEKAVRVWSRRSQQGGSLSVRTQDDRYLYTFYCLNGVVSLETLASASERAPIAWQALSAKFDWEWPLPYNSRPYKTGPFDDGIIELLRSVSEEAQTGMNEDG